MLPTYIYTLYCPPWSCDAFRKIFKSTQFIQFCFCFFLFQVIFFNSSQSMALRPVASPSWGNVQKCNLRLCARTVDSETLGMEPSNCFLTSPPGGSDASLHLKTAGLSSLAYQFGDLLFIFSVNSLVQAFVVCHLSSSCSPFPHQFSLHRSLCSSVNDVLKYALDHVIS